MSVFRYGLWYLLMYESLGYIDLIDTLSTCVQTFLTGIGLIVLLKGATVACHLELTQFRESRLLSFFISPFIVGCVNTLLIALRRMLIGRREMPRNSVDICQV